MFPFRWNRVRSVPVLTVCQPAVDPIDQVSNTKIRDVDHKTYSWNKAGSPFQYPALILGNEGHSAQHQ
jgi:hypothetical protein